MGSIRILPEQIVNKIAAGEVIERPSSVAKELVENALDAQATMIATTIRHGGKNLIKVVDNGAGMDREDAVLCLKSHATSKIKELEDIFTIHSLGFRGEALSSVTSVSRMTLRTRNSSQQVGIKVEAIGGEIQSVREEGMPVGTSIEVSDLFFNTPARKKFLRGERVEYASIAELLTTMSLAYPQVAFKLYRDDALVFDYPPCAQVKERLLSTHYREWVEYLIPLENEDQGVSVTGYVGKAELSRSNRTAQFFFVNKRPIKSLSLSYALQSAYQGLLSQGRFPVALIFLEIAPAAVDVNVHPTKREVRLEQEKVIQGLLTQTIKETLGKYDHSPKLFPSYTLDRKKSYVKEAVSPTFDFKEIKEKVARAVDYQGPLQQAMASPYELREPEETRWSNEKNTFKVITPLGQIKGSYILAETEEGLMIIDQHAAHERIVYEHILDAIEKKNAVSQSLLIPVTVECNFKEAQLLEDNLDILTPAGFSISHLGNNTFCIDATPALLGNIDPKGILQGVLDELSEGKGKVPLHGRKEHMAKLLACKSQSIKANEELSVEEMERLISGLAASHQPFTCPHGRPTFIKFTIDELEKHFKRR
jgi:DNA mismatch repair protein MutL